MAAVAGQGDAAVVQLHAAGLARPLLREDVDEVAADLRAALDAELGLRQRLDALGWDDVAAADAVLHRGVLHDVLRDVFHATLPARVIHWDGFKTQQERRDSNPQQAVLETAALPLSYAPVTGRPEGLPAHHTWCRSANALGA